MWFLCKHSCHWADLQPGCLVVLFVFDKSVQAVSHPFHSPLDTQNIAELSLAFPNILMSICVLASFICLCSYAVLCILSHAWTICCLAPLVEVELSCSWFIGRFIGCLCQTAFLYREVTWYSCWFGASWFCVWGFRMPRRHVAFSQVNRTVTVHNFAFVIWLPSCCH